MPRPSKPVKLIELEGKSHRTKKEIEQRKESEKKLLSHVSIKESKEVRDNSEAHKEFKRVKKLLENIEKNDELYGSVINRYCLLLAECKDLVVKREELYELIKELKQNFKELTEDMTADEKANLLCEFSGNMVKLANAMTNCDKMVQAKRKMLLDIEKECVMTIAASLRSIPKQADSQEDDPLLKVLRGG